ncbi:hypothetical protein SAMN05660199_00838 [Klenkia soli]|uniref:Uncharacterized protein n=1 Tax=Klenkia soli TaxID=1052260 RepID=A0A1H0EQZ4_9ACTN|nr:hypothetical protein [Klenkia soli]SDN84887.1 hypothetical protein SAMN05660199_00838 [Klenkia soli]
MPEFAYEQSADQMVSKFGFTAAFLRDAVVARAAAAARSYAGGLYPPAASGMARWMHSVAYTREALSALGYEPNDTDLISKVIHRERGLAIVCAAGNPVTGVPFMLARKYPTTKWPKGERTAVAVARNNEQMTFFDELDEDEEPIRPLETWLLLQYADREEVRAELSLPAAINHRGFITDWHQRYILPPLSNDGGIADEPIIDDGDEEGGGIVVPVEPR